MTQFSWLRGNPLFAGGSCSSVCGAAEDVSDQAAQRGGNSVSERDRYLRKPSRTAHFTFLLWGTSFEVNRWVHVEEFHPYLIPILQTVGQDNRHGALCGFSVGLCVAVVPFYCSFAPLL